MAKNPQYYNLRSNRAKDSDRFDYAWKWFAYHADQRVKMFNFMLVADGLLATAVITALGQRMALGAAALCFIASALASAFTLLDARNQQLIWFGEDVLFHLEHNWIFKEQPGDVEDRDGNRVAYGILRRERDKKLKAKKTGTQDGAAASAQAPRGRPSFPGSHVRDAMASKHRVLLKAVAMGIAFLFATTGIVILSFPQHVIKQDLKPAGPQHACCEQVDSPRPSGETPTSKQLRIGPAQPTGETGVEQDS